MTIDWSSLVYRCDPGVGQEITTVHPALMANFYLLDLDPPAVGQLYESAMGFIKEGITHYQAEAMKRPAAITPAALTMVPTWMRKPKAGHRYWWRGQGGADPGCAPPCLDLLAWSLRPGEKERFVGAIARRVGPGEVPNYSLGSEVSICFPVDHPLGAADRFLPWLSGLDLVKKGGLSFAECGYGLSTLAGPFGGETERRTRAWCSRYPGLDLFEPWHHNGMYHYDPAYPDLVPLVKRAGWMTLLHARTVQLLGGEDKLRSELVDTPEIRVHPAGGGGLILQAGERPQLGDLNRGDYLPLYRKVAAVLRPARVTRLADKDEFWDHFFNIFDKSYAN
jgi:hypothetical protein